MSGHWEAPNGQTINPGASQDDIPGTHWVTDTPPPAPAQATAGSGFSYQPISTPGVPANVSAGYGSTAGLILTGTQQAQQSLQNAYQQMFLSRVQGVQAGYQENERKLGGEFAASGMNPAATRLGAFQRQEGYQQQLGTAQGDAQQSYFEHLAQLQKGTGTELAQLKQKETTDALNAYLSSQGLKQAGDAANSQQSGQEFQALASLAVLAFA